MRIFSTSETDKMWIRLALDGKYYFLTEDSNWRSPGYYYKKSYKFLGITYLSLWKVVFFAGNMDRTILRDIEIGSFTGAEKAAQKLLILNFNIHCM